MERKNIQMVDLMGQYRKIKDQIDKNLIDCIESGRLVNGPIVSDFCNNLSKYLERLLAKSETMGPFTSLPDSMQSIKFLSI